MTSLNQVCLDSEGRCNETPSWFDRKRVRIRFVSDPDERLSNDKMEKSRSSEASGSPAQNQAQQTAVTMTTVLSALHVVSCGSFNISVQLKLLIDGFNMKHTPETHSSVILRGSSALTLIGDDGGHYLRAT